MVLKIFPVILIIAGMSVIAGGFGVSAHTVDDSNIMEILSHCDGAETPEEKKGNGEKKSGGLLGALGNLFDSAEEKLQGVKQGAACAFIREDLAELKPKTRALLAQINEYIRLLGLGISLCGVVLVLVGASNLAAVWRK